jgi:C_GCAxxG_C_C family probable redox protein
MMSLKEERAVELYANNYNCAQSVIGAFCEELGLDLDTALKLATGFGGGLRCGGVCGAVTGAVMAIGLKCGFYIKGDMEQKAYCGKKAFEFIELFRKENGSELCRDLLGIDIRVPEDHITPESKAAHKAICPKLVASAVRVLEKMEFMP